ncbi:MAG: porin [Rhodomicrobiaceae bacterium]
MKTKLSLAALLAGGMMVATSGSASAADLGGDCCADLEERVATLEATTARKGNRKVSLTISGQVNQAIVIWDDGEESDAYVASNSASASRFRFKGGAKINSDWSAGYYIEIGLATARTMGISNGADGDDGGGVFRIRQSNMYVKSKTLGKLTWGQASPATDDLAFSADVSGLAGAFQPDFHSQFGFNFRRADGTLGPRVRDLGNSLNGTLFFDGTTRQNVVRYDTPTIAGFVLSAAWGEDDFWDIALRTTQKIGDFTFKLGVGYNEFGGNDTAVTDGEEQSFTANAGLIHNPTGIFVHGSYRGYEYDGGTVARSDADGYHIKAGIKQRWNTLGKTAIYGGYTQIDDGGAGTTPSEISRVSFGIHQWIDAAALELYAVYDHVEGEENGVDYQDIDTVTIGGRIKF